MLLASLFFPTSGSEAAYRKRRNIPLLPLWALIACEIDLCLEILYLRITLINVQYWNGVWSDGYTSGNNPYIET
jgi:hypothetical protein